MLEIRKYPDPILKEKSLPVIFPDDEVKDLVESMFEVMHANKGVGLAAPQVGVLKRIIIANPNPSNQKMGMAFINPVIKWLRGADKLEEGCLSFPGEFIIRHRYALLNVEAQDINGRRFALDAKGLFAQIIQHEVEHLDAILLNDEAYFNPMKEINNV